MVVQELYSADTNIRVQYDISLIVVEQLAIAVVFIVVMVAVSFVS